MFTAQVTARITFQSSKRLFGTPKFDRVASVAPRRYYARLFPPAASQHHVLKHPLSVMVKSIAVIYAETCQSSELRLIAKRHRRPPAFIKVFTSLWQSLNPN